MEANKWVLLFLGGFLFWIGCTQRRPENEYQRKIGQYMYLLKLNSGKLKTDSVYEFTLRIKREDKSNILNGIVKNEAEFNITNEYLTNNVKDNIQFIVGKDTLPTEAFQYVNNGQLAPYVDLLFFYKLSETQSKIDEKILQYDDILFGNGHVNFAITQ